MARSILLGALLLSLSNLLMASDLHRFDIAEQSAERSLNEFVKQAEVSLLFVAEEVRGVTTRRLYGEFTVEAALTRLLAATRLQGRINEWGVLTVTPMEQGEVSATTQNEGEDTMHTKKRSIFGRIGTAIATTLFATSGAVVKADEAGGSTRADGNSIEEIIVTASYRDTAMMDTPIAISALTDELLEDKGVTNIQTLYQSVPSLSYRTSTSTFNTISIRGLTPIGGTSVVSVYVDEVPVTDQNDGGTRQIAGALFDLERVEVLKGPQGTLYGEGSVGGTLRYITKEVDLNTFDFKVGGNAAQISESDDLSTRFNALVNIPLIQDRLGVRLSGYYRDQAGMLDIAAPRNEDDVDTQEEKGARIKLSWHPMDKLEVALMGNYSETIFGGPGSGTFPYGNTELTSAVFPNEGEDLQKQVNLTVRYDLGFAEFVSASSYSERELELAEEFSQINVDLFFEPLIDLLFRTPGFPTFDPTLPAGRAFAAGGLSSDLLGRSSERFVQEFRLISQNESQWSWTTGLYHSEGRAINGKDGPNFLGFLFLPNPGFEATIPLIGASLGGSMETQFEREETSAYGEVNYAFNEAWDLTVGARISRASTDLVHSNTDLSDTFVSPKAILSWRPTDQTLFYGTVAQGFRQGLANSDLQMAVESGRLLPPSLVPGLDAFLAEFGGIAETDGDTLTTFEVGVKTEFWDGRINLTSALYYMEWEDNLIEGSTTPPHTGAPIAVNFNGDEAHSQGIEMEVTALLTDRLTFTFGGDINDEAQLDDLNSGPIILDSGIIMEGNRLPNGPKYSWNTSLSYRFPFANGWSLDARADWYRVASSFNDATNSIETPGYHQVNGRFTLRNTDGSWRIALFGENLADEVIAYEISSTGIRFGRPRTIGLEFSYQYGGVWK